MRPILLDTHLLLWAAGDDPRLPAPAAEAIQQPDLQPLFSAASIWEVVIKSGLGRRDFRVEPAVLRRGLVDNGYAELPITSAHTLAVSSLPDLHRDPFDRIIIAQAHHEGIELYTSDRQFEAYPGAIRVV